MRLVEVTKVNIIIDEVLVNVTMVEVIMVKGGIKKLFFYFWSKGGGVSANPKNPYQKNLRFFYAYCSKALSCNSALPFWPAWHILKYFPHSTCLSCLLACEDLRPVCAKHSGEAVVQLPLEWHRRRAEGRCWHYLHLIILLGLYLLAIPSSRYNLLLASV